MDWFVKAFIKASVAWLAVGITLGVAMALNPQWTIYRPAHLHMNLAGFVAMMIFGVAYHVVPRFVGVPLDSGRAAGIHWFLANGGLLVMVAGFFLRSNGIAAGEYLLGAGGIATALGGYIFAVLLWKTIDGAAPARGPSPPVNRDTNRSTLPLVGGSVIRG
jgi:heme/copper-type cytochrome/quinol oxidase subunit 1